MSGRRDAGERAVTAPAIRRCTDDDWPEVRRLHLQLALGVPVAVDVDINDVFTTPERSWRDFTTACAHEPDQALLLAEVDGTCSGMGHVRLDHGVARLDTLFVNEARRRHGLGAALVDALETWARRAGARQLVCHIPDSSPAVHLAEHAGWQRTEECFTAKNRLVERRWLKDAPG